LTTPARDGAQQRGNANDKRDITDDIGSQDIKVHVFPPRTSLPREFMFYRSVRAS
jgi:hypothetical protein